MQGPISEEKAIEVLKQTTKELGYHGFAFFGVRRMGLKGECFVQPSPKDDIMGFSADNKRMKGFLKGFITEFQRIRKRGAGAAKA